MSFFNHCSNYSFHNQSILTSWISFSFVCSWSFEGFFCYVSMSYYNHQVQISDEASKGPSGVKTLSRGCGPVAMRQARFFSKSCAMRLLHGNPSARFRRCFVLVPFCHISSQVGDQVDPSVNLLAVLLAVESFMGVTTLSDFSFLFFPLDFVFIFLFC